ncbi:MAG: hypothetical protein NVS4B8_28210 [Herpetosiphon sp.]
MLDQLDLEQQITKDAYKQSIPELQARLFAMEEALLEAHIPTLILFEGWAGTAKVGTIKALTRCLDPRGLRVHPIAPPRTSETHYPWLYRFWHKTPRYGQIAIFDRSWYREVLAARTAAGQSTQEWRSRCKDIVAFERDLAADGALIIKLWLHISKKEQGRRFRQLLADPLTAWQVTKEDEWQHRHYGRVKDAVEELLMRTDTPTAPWVPVAATDQRFAHVAAFETILQRCEARLGRITAQHGIASDEVFDGGGNAFRRELSSTVAVDGSSSIAAEMTTTFDAGAPPVPLVLVNGGVTPEILQRVDLTQTLDEATYKRRLARLQAKLHLLGLQIYLQKRPVVLVFEGWDAAGKGGAIQRITDQLDPRAYTVHAIAAPSGDDKAHHYLYRFWRRLPPQGAMAIYDRSWYGRVLVERVEGFARVDEWQRAYNEINEFEHQLVSFGTIVCKFWLHLTPAEQLRRFEERQSVPHKAWKLTDEDWRNREKWPQYEHAAEEMLARTSPPDAPWTVVEAEDKRFARIKVLSVVVQQLEQELGKVKL